MMDDDTFTAMAKADFTMRLVCGMIAGTIGLIVGIVLIVLGAIKNMSFLIPMGIALILIGLLVGLINGFLFFGRRKDSLEAKDKKSE